MSTNSVLETQLGSEYLAMLEEKTRWARLSTIDEQGYPHTVPLGFRRVGPLLVLRVRAGTQKVRNLQADPRASVLIDSNRSEPVQRGVLLRGRGRVWLEQSVFESFLAGIDSSQSHAVANWGADTAFITFATERCTSWTLGARS